MDLEDNYVFFEEIPSWVFVSFLADSMGIVFPGGY